MDNNGRPLADEAVRPVRPTGLLWQAVLRTDAAGVLTLWSLEPGRHRVLNGDPPLWHEVQVPELVGEATRPDSTRVTFG
jgi:hypothetical protein